MNEMLAYVTAWMNLADVMLSKISQSQKEHYYIIQIT